MTKKTPKTKGFRTKSMVIGNNQIPYRRFAKLFCTWDSRAKLLRLGRLVWKCGEGPGFGKGHCSMLSLALTPKLFGFRREHFDTFVTLFGVRLHFQRSFGGWIC